MRSNTLATEALSSNESLMLQRPDRSIVVNEEIFFTGVPSA